MINYFLQIGIATAFLILCCPNVYAQELKISLSQKHLEKIEKIKSPSKKLKKYRKYYSKDSLKLFKQAERFVEYWSDSVERITNLQRQKWTKGQDNFKNSLTEKLSKKGTRLAAKATVRESDYKLSPEWEKYYSPTSLAMLYNYMRYYLIELRTDTLQLKRLGIPKEKMQSVAGLDRMKEKVDANKLGIEDPVTLGKGKSSQLKGRVKGHKSLRSLSKEHKQLAKYKEQTAAYRKIYGKLPTSKDGVVDFGKSTFTSLSSQRSEVKQVEALKKQLGESPIKNPWDSGYKEKADQLQDSTYIKEQAKKKAEELAMRYIEENPAVMEGVQKKMALLMRKYSIMPNSNDLSSAVKRSSLEGKPLRERLYLAANFQVISLEPVSIDFAPALGYKINRSFILGIGGMYRETFTKNRTQLSPDVVGYKTFTSYDIVRSFFAYGEYANNSPGMKSTETGKSRVWKPTLFAGFGRKFLIHPKVEMTCLVTYNFLHEENDPIYPRPFMVRVGFQTSQLSMLKR